jgi:hypothetical protein
VTAPTAEQQLKFLTNLQRLLDEGQFVATYKYALLLALADIAVEFGDDSGEALTIPTRQIAEKFIQYYWRQVVPYVPRNDPTAGQVLRQNTGSQAAIIRQVMQARRKFDDSLADAQRDAQAWNALVREVDQVVRQMPLWKLQTVGGDQFDFLYENRGAATSIELRPGVAYCLRHFYSLIGDLVRGAWTRYVRRHNHDALGTTSDLSEFLFGSERADMTVVRTILEEVQADRCFYCERSIPRQSGHVDHFIPWSKYPVDLGHNFVVAHQACNAAKADHLAAAEFLAAWAQRNVGHRDQLAKEFDRCGVLHDLPTSVRIAGWAYQQAYEAGGLTWAKKEELVPLGADWQRLL